MRRAADAKPARSNAVIVTTMLSIDTISFVLTAGNWRRSLVGVGKFPIGTLNFGMPARFSPRTVQGTPFRIVRLLK